MRVITINQTGGNVSGTAFVGVVGSVVLEIAKEI